MASITASLPTGGLRGRKRSLFEGGVSTLFIVALGLVMPGGHEEQCHGHHRCGHAPDVLCDRRRRALPADYQPDGENLLEAFNGKPVIGTRPIFWQWLGLDKEPDWWPRLACATVIGNW